MDASAELSSPLDRSEFWLGDVCVRVHERKVAVDGRDHKVEPKVMGVLLCLAARPGEVVRRGELFDAVWPRMVVADDVLSRCIYQLRKTLGDNPDRPAFIETVPKVGYRLLVAPALDGGESAPPVTQRKSRLGAAAWWMMGLAAVSAGLAAYVWRDPPQPPAGPPEVAMMPITVTGDDVGLAVLAMALNDRLRSGVAEHQNEPRHVTLAWRPSHPDSARLLDPAGPHYTFHGTLQPNPGERWALLHLYIDSISGSEVVTSPLNVFEVPPLGSGSDVLQVATYREAIIQRILYYLTVELPYVHEHLDELETEAFRLLMYADWELYSGKDCGIGAHSLLERAVELNPKSARAWAQLGEAYWAQIWDCGRGRPYVKRALSALDRALALEPDSVAGAYMRTIVRAETGEVEAAYAEMERYLEASPDDIYLLYARMEMLVCAGFLEASAALADRIAAADPLAMSAELVDVPMSLLHLGRYSAFLEQAPTKPIAFMYYYRALAHWFRGDRERTLALLERQRNLASSSVFADYGAALRAYLDDDSEAAVTLVRGIDARRVEAGAVDAESAFREAQLLALAGAVEPAIERVERAVTGGFFCPGCYRYGPGFDQLRGHPRFEAAMHSARQRHLEFARRFDLTPELPAGSDDRSVEIPSTAG